MKAMKIEKNIPIPPRRYKIDKLTKLLNQMEIGDSFLSNGRYSAPTIIARARIVGIKLIQRKTIEGIRFWRVPESRGSSNHESFTA